ncbi:uncharacterized protein LOC134840193 [Symsagittifera roscoffensis]|uniref:uncharacterized protein LOC134840193 n=1 Tax=Symsagittifera roscoffensis TaxID=84072 RepID=UPI00307C3E3C
MRLRENGMEKFCQTWEIMLPLENEGDEDRFLSEWKVNYFFQPLIKRAKVIMRIKESRHEAESYYVIVRSARSGLSLLRYVWGPFKIDEISSELLVRPDGKRFVSTFELLEGGNILKQTLNHEHGEVPSARLYREVDSIGHMVLTEECNGYKTRRIFERVPHVQSSEDELL